MIIAHDPLDDVHDALVTAYETRETIKVINYAGTKSNSITFNRIEKDEAVFDFEFTNLLTDDVDQGQIIVPISAVTD